MILLSLFLKKMKIEIYRNSFFSYCFLLQCICQRNSGVHKIEMGKKHESQLNKKLQKCRGRIYLY